MELKDLAGEHMLSGVDFESEPVKDWLDREVTANACRFCLDGVVYVASEDESDGYRSSMRELVVSARPITNPWPPVRVVCSYSTRGQYSGDDADFLEIRDATTGGLVLRVGTDNVSDYYPSYVAQFSPEFLAHNAPKIAPG